MEKNTKYAILSPIETGVVFSDSCSGNVVYWQYQRDFQAAGWLMKLETTTEADNLINIRLSIGRPTLLAGIQTENNGSGREFTTYPGNYIFEEVEIETDRQVMFLGTTENFLQYGDGRAIRTGHPGLLGDLYVFTNRGEKDPSGFLLLASIDGTVMNEEEFFAAICSSFEASAIEKEVYEAAIDPDTISFKLARLEELHIAQAASKKQLHTKDREPHSN